MTKLLVKLFIKNSENTSDPEIRQKYGFLSGFVGIVMNLILFTGKIIAGLITASISIVADAFNNLSDAGSSIITLVGFKMAGRPADREHPYGHGRIEYVSGFIVSIVIMLMGFELGKSSFEKIFSPEEIAFNWLSFGILIGSILIKPVFYALEEVIFKDDPNHKFTGGANLLSAIVVLAIMILPTIINITETTLKAVPNEYREASYGLGGTKIQTIFKVVIPAGKSGIASGIVLGVGRAIGEAMAIMMVAGNAVNMPLPFNSVRFLTTGIVSEFSYSSGLHREALFGIGLVLFVFIMVINIVLNRILKNGGEKN